MNDSRPQLLQLNSQSSADGYILTDFGVFVKKQQMVLLQR